MAIPYSLNFRTMKRDFLKEERGLSAGHCENGDFKVSAEKGMYSLVANDNIFCANAVSFTFFAPGREFGSAP